MVHTCIEIDYHLVRQGQMMEQEYTMALHLLGALGARALIGLECSFHGRSAGFRIHTLVCVISSLSPTARSARRHRNSTSSASALTSRRWSFQSRCHYSGNYATNAPILLANP